MTPQITLAIAGLTILTSVTLCYGWMCWVDPFVTCSTCSETGAVADPRTGRTRPCRACKRHGIRLRAGRHVLNAYLRNKDTSRIPNHPTKPTTSRTDNQANSRTNSRINSRANRLDW